MCRSHQKSEDYTITNLTHECSSDKDHFHCWDSECLNLCRNMYTCTCYDYANGHLCRHVHRVHSIWVQESFDIEDSSAVALDSTSPMDFSNNYTNVGTSKSQGNENLMKEDVTFEGKGKLN